MLDIKESITQKVVEESNGKCSIEVLVMCELDQLVAGGEFGEGVYDYYSSIVSEVKKRKLKRSILAAKRLGMGNLADRLCDRLTKIEVSCQIVSLSGGI